MEWILTDNKLPQNNDDVIYSTGTSSKFGYYDIEQRQWYYYDPMTYDPVKYEHDDVIAWMPKPDVYEKVDDD